MKTVIPSLPGKNHTFLFFLHSDVVYSNAKLVHKNTGKNITDQKKRYEISLNHEGLTSDYGLRANNYNPGH